MTCFETHVEISRAGTKAQNEMEVEEYCWAITQAAGRACCFSSGSNCNPDFSWTALCVRVNVRVNVLTIRTLTPTCASSSGT